MLPFKNLNRFNKSLFFFLVLAVTCAVQSCHQGEDTPDVSGIKVSLNIRHLEQDLGHIDTTHIAAGLQQIAPKYPDFLNLYLDTIMNFGIHNNYVDSNSGIRQGLHSFLTYKDFRGLFDTVAKHFPDTKAIDADLTQGMQYMKHYYPTYPIPRLIYYITDDLTSLGALTVDTSIIGVGLHMYLGPQYPYYQAVQVPDYQTRLALPEYAAINVFKAIYEEQHPIIKDGHTLLDIMIQRGKECYFLGKILPFKADTLRLAYTQKQLDWCQNNESQVYNFFTSDNLLYNTQGQKITSYIDASPVSAGMPTEAPGNTGSWLGLQIVKAWMKEHPKVTLAELLARQDDAAAFLQDAHYKPH